MWIGFCHLSGNYCGVGVIRALLDKLRQTTKILSDVYFSSDAMSGAAGLVCKSFVPGMEAPLHYSPSLSTNRMPLHSTMCEEKPPSAACASSGFSCCSGMMPTCMSPPA